MKTLVYATCGFADPYIAVLMEAADAAHDRGEDVVLAHCDEKINMCFENPSGNSALCCMCKHCIKRFVGQRKEWLRRLVLKVAEKNQKIDFSFETVYDIRRIEYRGCRIGYGVLSTYISLTRDCFPDFSKKELKNYFQQLLTDAARVTDYAYQCMEQENPDKVVLFNGRFFENRAFHEVAKIKGIPFESNEVIGGFRTHERFKRMIYPNVMPHDVNYNTQLISMLWNSPKETIEEKTRKGSDFYERRRRGVVAGDRVYIGGQQKGMLPKNWDSSKRNFVIFNSSEDEFAAIGPEFEKFAIFKSQYDGIKYMLENITDPDIHFYLRVHPNLMRVHYAYRDDLLGLPSHYKNITVVDADDPCSTYDMMDAAEKVIVFGSTAGAEAVYWGKPVVLLAASYYHELGMTYNPSSGDELVAMLRKQLQIIPEGKKLAIQYGYFILNRNLSACEIKNFDVDIATVSIFGKRLPICRYNTLLGSVWLMKFCRIVLKYGFRMFGKIKLPTAMFVDPAYVK